MSQRTRKLHRIAAGLSQEQAAAAVGISQTRYSQYERGTKTPDAELQRKIAATLGVSVQELFGKSTDPAAPSAGAAA